MNKNSDVHLCLKQQKKNIPGWYFLFSLLSRRWGGLLKVRGYKKGSYRKGMHIEDVGEGLKLLGQWLRSSHFIWNRVESSKLIVTLIFHVAWWFYGSFTIEKWSKWINIDLEFGYIEQTTKWWKTIKY